MMDNQPSKARYVVVMLLFFHTVNTYMDRICISTAKGAMQSDLTGLTDQMMGYAFGIFAIGYALFQIPAGWYSDRAGARHALTVVVVVWSLFTAWTGFVFTAIGLLVVRFLFGAGEAGAYPGATRALYSWLPAKERGLGQGIFHSGARIGAAASLVLMPIVINAIGWRATFVLNAVIGLVWGAVWWFWYRDDPADHPSVNEGELNLIQSGIAQAESNSGPKVPYIQVVTSTNVLLAMFQYAASNITFFISMTWLRPYIVESWGEKYGWCSSIPLLFGAVALWCSGYLVTALHKLGHPVMSRRLPAMVGYSLGAIGLLMTTQTVGSASVWPFIACFSLALFGVEMTLSPSWAFCMDIGGSRSGAVSAAMNMVGNLGAAVSAVAFPYFVSSVTVPFFAESTGTANSFFLFAATMNLLAVFAWLFMNPLRQLKTITASALKLRLALFIGLFVIVLSALLYTKFFFQSDAGTQPEPVAAEVQEAIEP
ncbi:putative sulfoacetate transporter SauU [Stieleria bergensis]|uniref:Putative sulfoacetate transporter SauU n=1 Tax=Stieleria bergensis TaxID=2528025 RepID=A0A517T2Q8_9BACT|nr:putative sulfoacetate transporter SauU [Planctomycetes bacterium SV_7m_r]